MAGRQVNWGTNPPPRENSGNYSNQQRRENTISSEQQNQNMMHAYNERRYGLNPGGLQTGPQLQNAFQHLERQGRWGGKKRTLRNKRKNKRKTMKSRR